ncbi:hypothetical protein PMAYCL1PPCAC_16002 [Pristionchus mayeri]|uniref:G protein-coupled receptor n=1 Tax=Pristionchus mayeri TaxID=1317129 RepID=A0AAN5HYR3_9BILA|nr:hypothetical protein PMAYCL1PPCAC_16002 [Pristionchus mayeri]
MTTGRPISDETIVITCRVIGVLSLPINVTSLVLICRMWKTSAHRIVVVLLALQVLYIIHNIHFTFFFIAFFYINVAGGYCIGSLCEPHYVSFHANIVSLVLSM